MSSRFAEQIRIRLVTTADSTVEDWLEKTGAALRSGEFLMAYDLASRALVVFPDNTLLQYQAVLALARSGATERAEELYNTFGLQDEGSEDNASLGARIAKDRYFARAGDANRHDAERAAKLYRDAYEQSGGYYPAINAATMSFFAGDTTGCRKLAEAARERCATGAPDENHQARYWRTVTCAEAALLLDQPDEAKSAIAEAANYVNGDHSAAASTRLQLMRICNAKGLDSSLLDPLKPPSVIFYAGHMIAPPDGSGQFAAGSQEMVRQRIEAMLETHDVGFGFGSLACGSDILFAEALISRGAELHAVIPFDLEEFKTISVRRGGAGWEERMTKCLEGATSVTHTTTGPYLGDDSLFNYAARIAMGFARIKAQNLSTDLNMFAVWNGEEPMHRAGTAVDVAFWRKQNLPLHRIDCGPPASNGGSTSAPAAEKREPARMIYPVMFADVKGFSKLSDNELGHFFEKVMGRLGGVLDRFGEDVLFRNTWGDAVHAVFRSVPAAASCALEMQKALGSLDSTELKLPARPEMRMALDVGPVFEGYDFIKKEDTYFGSTLTRAARMEPVTPVGEVFVTEAFAALSAMDCADNIRCEYVGRLPLAHSYGDQRMYLLRETGGPSVKPD